MQVSPAVKKYKRIADIINDQILIVKEYKNAFNQFKMDANFTIEEITYLGKVYSNLFNASLKDVDELIMVITASTLRMSDDERLSSIDKIFAGMQDKLTFLRYFNNNTTLLAVQRAKERNDVSTIQNIYGLPK